MEVLLQETASDKLGPRYAFLLWDFLLDCSISVQSKTTYERGNPTLLRKSNTTNNNNKKNKKKSQKGEIDRQTPRETDRRGKGGQT